MKKLMMIALVLILGMSGSAWAKKITCKKGTEGTFTVDVPEGWAYKDVPGGCAIAKKDGSNHFISIAYYKNNNLNARVFADQMCKTMNVQPKYLTHEDNYTSMLVTSNGLEVRIGIAIVNDKNNLACFSPEGFFDL